MLAEKNKVLVIIRGLPCSSKTTIARRLVELLPSADNFEPSDYYIDNPRPKDMEGARKHIHQSHVWCRNKINRSCKDVVLVSNVFAKQWEVDKYVTDFKKHHREGKVIIFRSLLVSPNSEYFCKHEMARIVADFEPVEDEAVIKDMSEMQLMRHYIENVVESTF